MMTIKHVDDWSSNRIQTVVSWHLKFWLAPRFRSDLSFLYLLLLRYGRYLKIEYSFVHPEIFVLESCPVDVENNSLAFRQQTVTEVASLNRIEQVLTVRCGYRLQHIVKVMEWDILCDYFHIIGPFYLAKVVKRLADDFLECQHYFLRDGWVNDHYVFCSTIQYNQID